MATLKQRLHRKNSSGIYDTVHLETSADLIVGTLGIAHGGTGLTASPSLLVDLASDQTANVLQTSPRPGCGGILPISRGGTGATTAANARTNLGITPGNIGAASSSHNHSASQITSGTLPVTRGGTGVTSIDALKSALGIGSNASYIIKYGISESMNVVFGYTFRSTPIVIAQPAYGGSESNPNIICITDISTSWFAVSISRWQGNFWEYHNVRFNWIAIGT